MTRPADEIFEEALTLDVAERGGFLCEACAGDEALLADLCSLLEAHDHHPDVLIRREGVPETMPPTIGPYRIVRLLGHGGAGRVYEAHDVRRDRVVAIKVLRGSTMGLRSEAQLLASLDHPTIAAVHAVETHEGRDVIVLERVAGTSLADRLREGPLTPQAAMCIGRQIAMALEAAHAAGVLHLDLKPANIMIETVPEDAHPRIKVLDFGIGRLMDGAGTTADGLRGTTLLRGTPGYADPALLGGRSPSVGSDAFGLGCILYECLTGHRAFSEQPTPDHRIEPDWERLTRAAPDLENLARRLLSTDPEARPIAAEVRDELSRAPSDGSATVRRVSTAGSRRREIVGRDVEQAHLHVLLRERPVLTLTGPGGVGKTRLAIEVSRTLGLDQVHVVDLAALHADDLVLEMVASSLGVRRSAGRPLSDSLIDRLSGQQTLLLLDGAEGRELEVATLLDVALTARTTTVFITSRAPVGFPGETVFRLASLPVPDETYADVESLNEQPSARLLLDRVRELEPTFTLNVENAPRIAAICRHVDGLPLALELMAPEVARDAPDVTLDSLDLHTVIDRSHGLLTATAARVFRRLSVFAGGWTLDDARAVLPDEELADDEVVDVLTTLVAGSLVVLDRGGDEIGAPGAGVRYRMLEPIRAFAMMRLDEAVERVEIAHRHRHHFARVVIDISPKLFGPDQNLHLTRLSEERPNLRAALAGFVDADGVPGEDIALGIRMGCGLGQFWLVRGHWREGRESLDRLISAAHDLECRAGANAVIWSGNLSLYLGEFDPARTSYERAVTLADAIGDHEIVARALTNLGAVHIFVQDFDEARTVLARGLALQERFGHDADIATTSLNLGVVAERRGELTEAVRYYEESLRIRARLEDNRAMALSLNNLGTVAEKLHDLDRAEACHREALTLLRALGDERGAAESLHNLGAIAARRGDTSIARDRYEKSLDSRRRLGDPLGEATTLEALAELDVDDDPLTATRNLDRADAIRSRIGVAATPDGEARRRVLRARLRKSQ